jgi:hypothetical protein
VSVRRDVVVVRSEHDRLTVLARERRQEIDHLGAGRRVEVAGRLVGEDDAQAGRERVFSTAVSVGIS